MDPTSWFDTGVGGGKKEFVGNDEDGKGELPLVDACEERAVEASSDPIVKFVFDAFALDCWIVDERLASNAASASGESVCENDKGGNGTLPGVGGTSVG